MSIALEYTGRSKKLCTVVCTYEELVTAGLENLELYNLSCRDGAIDIPLWTEGIGIYTVTFNRKYGKTEGYSMEEIKSLFPTVKTECFTKETKLYDLIRNMWREKFEKK